MQWVWTVGWRAKARIDTYGYRFGGSGDYANDRAAPYFAVAL